MKKLILLFSFVIIISLVLSVSCVSKEVPVTETYYETEYRTETYTATEDVVTNTNEGVTDLIPKKKWWGEWWLFYDYTIAPPTMLFDTNRTSYYGYDISANQHSKSQIKINYQIYGFAPADIYVFDLSSVGQISLPASIGKLGRWDNDTYIPAPEEEEWLKHWCNPENLIATCPSGQTTYVFDCENIRQFAVVETRGTMLAGGVDVQSVQLVWADQTVEKKTVTKERQVPYQLEKQRTVMQTQKVPFWEAIFSE